MIEAKRLRLFQGIEFGRRDVILILSSFLVFGIFMPPLYFETGRYAYVAVAGAGGGASALFLILRPVIARDERRTNINSNIPLFITAFATLSTSDANRVDLLEILSRKDKIGYIREDLARLVNLVKRWKRGGLSEAAMLLASRTPSEVFADFLARFGHAIDSGQDFQEFILNESDTVMSNFETAYISALYTFDLYKDMYVSMLLSFAFLVAFVMIMPVLIPMNVTVVFALSFLAIILGGEAVLMYGIKIVLPNDPIWHDTGLRTEVQDHMRRILMMAGAACVAILAVLFATRLVYRIPFYFSVAMVITRWPGPAWLARGTRGR
ncbi:type II secretion system F family protein [Thermogymnomonas acidicola]|uniref:type II secretion system F family protein n=1 Tax=Thermogymnomonas acidicola TaxID=399579 RepID=UPI000B2EEC9C|nr:type II secretion system F family protein [Thermogymnomonas acidicola]